MAATIASEAARADPINGTPNDAYGVIDNADMRYVKAIPFRYQFNVKCCLLLGQDESASQ